jgi:hypothetical protein
MALPSCNATITLRVTGVRIRVKDHAFKKLKPCRRAIGSIRRSAFPVGAEWSDEKHLPFLGRLFLLLSAGATAGLHNETMLYQQIGHPDLWPKFHSASR